MNQEVLGISARKSCVEVLPSQACVYMMLVYMRIVYMRIVYIRIVYIRIC